jgi:hypothetical protein
MAPAAHVEGELLRGPAGGVCEPEMDRYAPASRAPGRCDGPALQRAGCAHSMSEK